MIAHLLREYERLLLLDGLDLEDFDDADDRRRRLLFFLLCLLSLLFLLLLRVPLLAARSPSRALFSLLATISSACSFCSPASFFSGASGSCWSCATAIGSLPVVGVCSFSPVVVTTGKRLECGCTMAAGEKLCIPAVAFIDCSAAPPLLTAAADSAVCRGEPSSTAAFNGLSAVIRP